MNVTGTPAAARAVEDVRQHRSGSLVFTIGTGCCESTAPFLYEDFWPGPDHEIVGEVADVPVYAPALLRSLYPGSDGFVIDVEDNVFVESFSIETEYGSRFVLRATAPVVRDGEVAPIESERPTGRSPSSFPPPTDVPIRVSALRPLEREPLPESLARLRTLHTHARKVSPTTR
jgi:uncharacterized protein (DUF779 family)